MPTSLSSYKVFIASPGGLERERTAFRDTVSSHNETDAIARCCHYQAVGWELTLGGTGRPQGRINEELKKCDYFVLLLWDRWGSSPGGDEGYSSGTEEEYKLAIECLKNKNLPMSEVIVFFKAVDPRQLSDPGPQLKAVQDFKKSLEKDKSLLFETFDAPELFGEKIRRHLAKWTRDHEKGEASPLPPKAEVVPHVEEVGAAALSVEPADFQFITVVQESSETTAAEEGLVRDLTIKRDMQSFDRYGLFLLKEERFSHAMSLYEEMQALARSTGKIAWAATAIARIGGIFRAQGKTKDAQSALENALRMKIEVEDYRGAASVYAWLGDLHFAQKRYQEARDAYLGAIESNPEAADQRKADLFFKLAKCYAMSQGNGEAKKWADEAYELAAALKETQMMASIKQWRKARKIR